MVLDEAVTEDYLTVSVSVFTGPYLAGGGGVLGWAELVLDEAVTEDYLIVSVSVFTEPYLAGGGGGGGGWGC